MSHAKTLILIVDNEEIVREALEGWLEKDGYTLSVALDNLDRRDRQLVSGAR